MEQQTGCSPGGDESGGSLLYEGTRHREHTPSYALILCKTQAPDTTIACYSCPNRRKEKA